MQNLPGNLAIIAVIIDIIAVAPPAAAKAKETVQNGTSQVGRAVSLARREQGLEVQLGLAQIQAREDFSRVDEVGRVQEVFCGEGEGDSGGGQGARDREAGQVVEVGCEERGCELAHLRRRRAKKVRLGLG